MLKVLVGIIFGSFAFYLGLINGGHHAINLSASACSKSHLAFNTFASGFAKPCDDNDKNPEDRPMNSDIKSSRPKEEVNCAKLSSDLPFLWLVPDPNDPNDSNEPKNNDLLFDPYHTTSIKTQNTGQLTSGGRTLIVAPSWRSSDVAELVQNQCTTVLQQYAHECLSIVFVRNLTGPTELKKYKGIGTPVVRFDRKVDRDGLVINGNNDDIVDRSKVTSLEGQWSKGVGSLDQNKGHDRPAGHFRRVPKMKGFQRVVEKLGPYVKHLDGPKGMSHMLDEKFKLFDVKKGDELVVMVVNEGETDLFLNFACSCKLHGIHLRNVLVFAGSLEMIKVIESTEAMALYHEGFASVSKKASKDYLDRVFVDMMWYKAFSTHLVLSKGINILFQDTDLVWFRNPFPFFKEQMEKLNKNKNTSLHMDIEAFFSDDGQRSKRYSPYFFNSGFYYMRSTPRSIHFTWSIMTAFDAVQVTGSHQNVFTQRLVEGLSLAAPNTQILKPYLFPNGILYHHDKAFMKRLDEKREDPYHFHMCWTQGKPQKLEYLKKVKMWYLLPVCSELPDLISPKGEIYLGVKNKNKDYHSITKQGVRGAETESEAWAFLGHQCCSSTGLSNRENY